MILIGAGEDAAAFARAVRGSPDAVVIVAVAPEVAAVERAAMLAMVVPLALELAPARRLVAIDIRTSVDPGEVAQVAHYLHGARPVTGQVIAIGG